MKFSKKRRKKQDNEFLWLISLSDLMILLFVFFVVLFSFTKDKADKYRIEKLMAELRHQPPPESPVDRVEKKLAQWAKELELTDMVSIERDGNSLVMQIKDKILFESGAFEPHISGIKVLRELSGKLEDVPPPLKIGIEGHTDNIPIRSATITDNWDLSAKRALAVLHAMSLNNQILERTVVMAHGEMDPILPNQNEQGQPLPENMSKNRRVTIRIF